MMTSINGKTPRLRFRGYDDAWEQCKFCNMVLIERGGSPRPIEDYITTDSEGLNWIKIGDAPIYGNYIISTSEKIKLSGLSKTRQVFPRDLILSNSMSFGKPYIVTISGCIHDGWLLIRDENCNFIKEFLCYLLGTNYMLLQYKSLAAGSTVNNLNKDLVGSTNISYPNKKEQEKIADVLSQIDNLISLHQRKYEKLVEVKKSLLDKMFPAEGETVPQIRFNGYLGAWENSNLWELTIWDKKFNGVEDYKQTSVIKYSYVLANKFDYMEDDSGTIRLLSTGTYIGYTTEDKAGEYLCEGEIVAIPWGGVPNVKYYNGKFVTADNRIATSSDTDKLSNKYLALWLQSRISVLESLYRGASIKHPSMRDVLDLKIIYPCIKEQKKISDLFFSLENLITLQQQAIEKLNNIKKSLLERMFV